MTQKTLNTLSSIERVILLKEVSIFEDLDIDDLKRLADLAHEIFFERGDKLITQGENGTDLYIIAKGVAEIRIELNGKETPVNRISQGDYFGEMALLEQSATRTAYVYAVTEMRTLIIDGDSFRSILHNRPEVTLEVMASLSRRIRELNRKLGF